MAVVAILLLHAVLLWAVLQTRGVQHVLLQAPPLLVQLLVADTAAPARAPTLPPPPPLASRAPPLAELPVPALPVQAAAAPAPQPPAPPVATVPAAAPAPAQAAPALATAEPPSRPSPAVATPAPAVPPPAVRQLPTAALQYIEPPVPVYPRLSRRNGESGRVLVRAFVDAAGGAPRSVQLAQSCGHPRLDEAALAAVQKARFKPTMADGQPVEGWALIPIDFELEAAR